MSLVNNTHDTQNALAALSARAPVQVKQAVQKASSATGIDFAYLMEQAAAESNFKTDIKARTSSATGLFQFIESTWLHMVRDHGDKYGMGQYAAAIDERGRVSDPVLRREILDLRKDPEKASLMAAEFARANRDYLEQSWGGEIGATEMYFAHFLGAGGASAFLKAKDRNAMAFGADLFPREAQANRNVFYDAQTGKPRTLAGIYDFFDKKFQASKEPAPVKDPSVYKQPEQQKPDIHNLMPYMSVITHPALEILAPERNHWFPQGMGVGSGLLKSPVEIMLMAELSVPLRNR